MEHLPSGVVRCILEAVVGIGVNNIEDGRVGDRIADQQVGVDSISVREIVDLHFFEDIEVLN